MINKRIAITKRISKNNKVKVILILELRQKFESLPVNENKEDLKKIHKIKGIVFGRRERWQKVKNVSEYTELEDLPCKRRNEAKSAKWENLLEKSEIISKKPVIK